ncbi:MAG: LysE family transporter [Candidatus Aegiribacteria sp.]|nr:LysE family transporter [Candidatus Aegiribacteria sp.]
MIESIVTISIVGLLAGFIFSIPVAGPISIFITSNALKGKRSYCFRAAIGASIIDFVYCFIAVYGFIIIYTYYKPYIPYIFLVGAVFLFIEGIKIFRTRLNIDELTSESGAGKLKKDRGGFWTGLLMNFLNPSLFIGWLLSSFLAMSYVASLGFNTGGMEHILDNNIKMLNDIDQKAPESHTPVIQESTEKTENMIPSADPQNSGANSNSDSYRILISLFYAFFGAIGSVLWFTNFSMVLIKYRKKLKMEILNRIIKVLGVMLCTLAFYLSYLALTSL